MAKLKCPICGGRVTLEYCEDCGYRVVDESVISSAYNYDPLNYPVPNADESKASNDFAEDDYRDNYDYQEEIYPNHQKGYAANSALAENKKDEEINTYNQNKPNMNNNPYADVNYQNENTQKSSSGKWLYLGEFIKTQLLQIILIIAIPFFGLIMGIFATLDFYSKSKNIKLSYEQRNKYWYFTRYMVAVTVLKCFFFYI